MLVVALARVGVHVDRQPPTTASAPAVCAVAGGFHTRRIVPVDPILLYTGLAFALVLRFEFMNTGFAKVVAFFAGTATGLIIYVFLAEALGDGTPPF
jgi:hypothetical protein